MSLACLPAVVLLAIAVPAVASAQSVERVDPIPPGPERIVKALSPFRADPDSADVSKLLAVEAKESRLAHTDFGRILIGRLWRRAGQTNLAIDALTLIDPSGPNADLATYEAARTAFEATEYDGVANPSRLYWRACASRDPRVRAEIAWDLLPVATPEERDAWRDVESGPATCEWLRRLWGERAQKMAISVDQRIALHHQRLAHVRQWYWIPRPRFSVGPSYWHGRPDGLGMDDRGLIYVRMGPPIRSEGFTGDQAGEFGSAVAVEQPDDVTGRSTIERSRCWPFWRPGGYRIYCFSQGQGRANGDYYLSESVLGQPGTRWFQQYVANSNLPPTVIRNRILAPKFPGLQEPWEQELNAAAARGWEHHGVVRTRENMDEALQRIPDVPTVDASVRVAFETLRFLNPGSRRWQIWTLATVRAGDLVAAADSLRPGSATAYAVGGRYAIRGVDGVELREFRKIQFPEDAVNDDTGLVLRGVLTADPGPMPITVVVEDLNAPPAGNWHQDTVNVPAIRGLPQLSDIAVAQSEGGTWTRDGSTFLRLTPVHVTNADGSIHTYFEVYGVRAGDRYEVDIRLAPTNVSDRIWRLEPDDLGFRLRFTSKMSGRIGRHHLRLDLSDTDPGAYVLGVRIQNATTRGYSLPAVTDILVGED